MCSLFIRIIYNKRPSLNVDDAWEKNIEKSENEKWYQKQKKKLSNFLSLASNRSHNSSQSFFLQIFFASGANAMKKFTPCLGIPYLGV